MAAFQLIGSYANGTTVDGPETADEFDNIYEAFNGVSTDKEIIHKFSGPEPALAIDQLGAGNILELRDSGVAVCSVDNTGKITSATTIITQEFDFFTPNPLNFIEGPEFLKRYVAPPNASRIINFKIIRTTGSHTGGSSIAFTILKNGVASGSTVSFSDDNNLSNTVYQTAQNLVIAEGDVIGWSVATIGTATERSVSISIEYEQTLS